MAFLPKLLNFGNFPIVVEFQASEAALKALSWPSKAADGTSEPFQHQVISLLSVAGWLFSRYDNEFKGFIEFTMPDLVNPRNSMSYLSTFKPTTPERETTQHQTRPELTFPRQRRCDLSRRAAEVSEIQKLINSV